MITSILTNSFLQGEFYSLEKATDFQSVCGLLSVNRVETLAFQASRFQQEFGRNEPSDKQVAGHSPGRYDRVSDNSTLLEVADELSKNRPLRL